MYIQLTDQGAFYRRIPSGHNIEWDTNNFCSVEALVRDGKAEQFHVEPLVAVQAPEHDALAQSVQELDPVSIDGVWTQQWTVVELPAEAAAANLAHAKAVKNDEINAARLAANFSTFTHAGKLIACDQLSRSDIDGTNGFVALYGALPSGWPGGWKAVDNSYVAIADVAAWKSFYASMFAAGNANFAHAQALKALLAAATTAAEVDAVRWGG